MVGHVLQQAGHERIMQVVYSFHMPMLFMLSGYFISGRKTWQEFALSRARRLLVPMFLSVGAAMASLIAEICVTTVQFIFVRKVFSPIKVFALCKQYFCCSICMTAVMAGMGNFLQLEAGIINTSILMVSGLGVYVFLLWVLKDDLFMWGVEKLRGKILRC